MRELGKGKRLTKKKSQTPTPPTSTNLQNWLEAMVVGAGLTVPQRFQNGVHSTFYQCMANSNNSDMLQTKTN